VKVDLHVHTTYSGDSLTSLTEVVRWARRRDLGAVAITDHDTIEGAVALSKSAEIPVIVGEEVCTQSGEICGLFLREAIPSGLSPRETVERIHDQGGLVYVPHPMDRIRQSTLEFAALLDIVDAVDILEVLNARVTVAIDNRHADDVARAYRLLRGAGSDAHQASEIGHAYVEMAPFDSADSFLSSLAVSQVCGRLSSPLVHVGSIYAKVAKDLMSLSPFAR